MPVEDAKEEEKDEVTVELDRGSGEKGMEPLEGISEKEEAGS